MRRYIATLLALFLLFERQQLTLQAESKLTSYNLENAIEDINSFIPGSKLIFKTAIKIWLVFGEVQQIADPNSTHIQESLDQINEQLNVIQQKLDDMSKHLDEISHDIKDLRDLITERIINDLPKEITVDQKLTTISDHVSKINTMFETFFNYNNLTLQFESDTVFDFVKTALSHGSDGVASHLQTIHQTLTDNSTGVSMLDILAYERQPTATMCKRFQSPHFFITELYNDVMQSEMKGLLILQFAYMIKLKYAPKNTTNNYKTELENAQNLFYKRTAKTIPEIKRALLRAPRDVWTCDQNHEENETHVKLDPVFQAYVMSEKDSNNTKYLAQFANKCANSCHNRNDSGDLCRSAYCFKHKNKCSGLLRECTGPDSNLEICLADKGSGRRYHYIELQNKKEVLGYKKHCNPKNKLEVETKMHWHRDCEYCMCTCESAVRDMARYFNLKEVTSDVHENKIVTGVRFAKENNVIHIQIEQGEILKNGKINESTVDWKNVDNYTIHDSNVVEGQDYHTISWNERSVQLDDLDVPVTSVLTGLRFRVIKTTLRLEIRSTPLSFYSGTLKANESKWIPPPRQIAERSELIFKDRDLPTASHLNVPDSNKDQYIRFTTSSLKTDIGQSVVPFIDIQPITAWPHVPLSGAALIHRGDPSTAGFLALKLRTFNFGPYIQEN